MHIGKWINNIWLDEGTKNCLLKRLVVYFSIFRIKKKTFFSPSILLRSWCRNYIDKPLVLIFLPLFSLISSLIHSFSNRQWMQYLDTDVWWCWFHGWKVGWRGKSFYYLLYFLCSIFLCSQLYWFLRISICERTQYWKSTVVLYCTALMEDLRRINRRKYTCNQK